MTKKTFIQCAVLLIALLTVETYGEHQMDIRIRALESSKPIVNQPPDNNNQVEVLATELDKCIKANSYVRFENCEYNALDDKLITCQLTK